MKKMTLREMTEQLEASSRTYSNLLAKYDERANTIDALKKDRDEVKLQFADLKERLFNTQMVLERLRGYVDRVQEDDIVREELLTVGEPGGEERLVPKRRHMAQQYLVHPSHVGGEDFYREMSSSNRPHQKPKHWINY